MALNTEHNTSFHKYETYGIVEQIRETADVAKSTWETKTYCGYIQILFISIVLNSGDTITLVYQCILWLFWHKLLIFCRIIILYVCCRKHDVHSS